MHRWSRVLSSSKGRSPTYTGGNAGLEQFQSREWALSYWASGQLFESACALGGTVLHDFRTRNNVIPVPDAALAANADIQHDRTGTQIPASIWFPHASADTPRREMKVHAEQCGVVLSLLHLPRSADVWPPWAEQE